MRISHRFLALAAALAAAAPVAAWSAFKPIRVLAPALVAGVECHADGICIDDPARLAEARALKAGAVDFVAARVAPVGSMPRFVFCSTAACAARFGITRQAAHALGTQGIVVGPKGWAPFFARHELIHHVQMEHLGSLHAWLLTPRWFLEGMAYSLSGDPRRPLPALYEGWRERFEAWYPGIPKHELWTRAAALRGPGLAALEPL